MKTLLCGLACLTLLAVGARAAEARPNILLLVADDLGYADLGFQGSKDIPTPNLDRLAAGGIRCTSGYVSHPFCSPTRAGLMTGRYQQRFGHEGNPAYNPADEVQGLPVTEVTLPELLRKAGYTTSAIGKWHLGAAPKFHPNRRGFEQWFGFIGGGHMYIQPVKGGAEYTVPLMRNDKQVAWTNYLTAELGAEAARQIRAAPADKPWFRYLAFNAPHTPLQVPPEQLAKFEKIADPQRRAYCAMVAAMDEAIGVTLDALRESGQETNTLVFFFSDNGGPGNKDKTAFADNAPLRGHKGAVYEGGVRVPFVVSWPGRLKPGVYDQPVISLDVLPTALALAGGRPPADRKIDGVNLLPYLTSERPGTPHEALFWRTGGKGGEASVRIGSEKLVVHRNGPPELYDLSRDVGEQKNIADAKQGSVAKLKAALDDWQTGLIEPLWSNPGQRKPAAPAAR